MGALRVLVGEDEMISALALRRQIESWGHEVLDTLARGDDMVRRAIELRPDVILMDVFLADDKTGLEAVEEIRATFFVPVIFMTASDDTGVTARATEIGCHGIISKPYEFRELKPFLDALVPGGSVG